MQGYAYSVFSLAAIAIHFIINFDLFVGRRAVSSARGRRYRGFLFGILAYYVADASWGVLAGLGWNRILYGETVLFFLSLVALSVMWGRFVEVYLSLGRRSVLCIEWSGAALLAFNVAALAVNPFTDCFYCFGEGGKFLMGRARNVAFVLLVAYNLLVAAFALASVFARRDAERRRGMMTFMFSATITLAQILQVLLPLTPFTALGCLVGNCFFHVFVVQDEQAARHMAELEAALARARSAEKARSLFFSIVSHDIRTPLNAILGYAELLEAGMKSEAETKMALKSIRASGTTLLQLVNDVLDLAKMDAGKMSLRPEPVLLFQLADDVFSSFWRAADEKDVKLVNKADGVPAVMLDGHRFRQILFNLVGNAVKFTDRGSVTVSASYAGEKLEVSVSDTGCGIAPDMLSRVLDPFVQALDPTHAADRAGGTGLGLSICRRLAENMGGELSVESRLGEGSTFTVRIPGVAAASAAVAANAAQAQHRAAAVLETPPKRVLVVDDSPVNRTVITALLRKAGVGAIDQACDGEEALKALDSAFKDGNPCDFVFSDFWMPNMNGLELIEKLRADPRFSSLKVFAVTADTEFGSDQRSKLFSGILLQPVRLERLVEAMLAA